jgi:formate hydrogenlyase subunit 6/NADH:ubiquinone oxidoreductase subunit I
MKGYFSKDIVLSINEEKCIGCRLCFEVCPSRCIGMRTRDDMRVKAYIVDKDSCIECSACRLNCPVSAVDAGSGVGCAQALFASYIDDIKRFLGINKS